MYDKLKKDLNLFTGELISEFIPFEKDKVIDFQTGLLSLSLSEANKAPKEKTNLFGIRNEDDLKNKLLASSVSPMLRKQASKTVISGQGMPRDVPPMGLIAVTLGLVSNDVKNELMACQAANRTICALEDWDKLEPSVENIDKNLYDQRDKGKQARHFIGGFGKDPQSLVAAQSINHMGDILSSLIACDKKLISSPYVTKAKEALETSAAKSLILAGENLARADIPRATEIISYGISIPKTDSTERSIQSAIKFASDSLCKQGIISDKQRKDIRHLAAHRAMQSIFSTSQNLHPFSFKNAQR